MISKAEHDREIAGLELEKASLEIPECDDMTRAGELLEDFGSLWSNATTLEQNKLARSVYDAVYIDFGERRIHSLQPKSAFAGLFRKMASRDDLGLEEAPGMPSSRKSDGLGGLCLANVLHERYIRLWSEPDHSTISGRRRRSCGGLGYCRPGSP